MGLGVGVGVGLGVGVGVEFQSPRLGLECNLAGIRQAQNLRAARLSHQQQRRLDAERLRLRPGSTERVLLLHAATAQRPTHPQPESAAA